MADLTIKKIKDVKVGDLVMGDDYQPRQVLNVVNGRGQMYHVHQTSGEDYLVNDGHILTLKKAEHCKKPYGKITKAGTLSHPNGRYSNYPDILDINVEEFIEKSNRFRENFLGYKVNSIPYPEREVLIDPYVLGVWLGDGTDNVPRFTISDDEILEYITEYADKIGLKCRVNLNVVHIV